MQDFPRKKEKKREKPWKPLPFWLTESLQSSIIKRRLVSGTRVRSLRDLRACTGNAATQTNGQPVPSPAGNAPHVPIRRQDGANND